MSALLSMVAASPSTEEEPEFALISASVVEMGGQGCSEDKTQKTRAALLRAPRANTSYRVLPETGHQAEKYNTGRLHRAPVPPSFVRRSCSTPYKKITRPSNQDCSSLD